MDMKRMCHSNRVHLPDLAGSEAGLDVDALHVKRLSVYPCEGNHVRMFASLRAVRAFTGLVPSVDQSGTVDHHGRPTKAGDPGLREALVNAADKARKVDPTLAARYHDLVVRKGKHHNAALCTLGAVLVTRLAGCWRNGTRYELRDTDGRPITPDEGREICAERYKVTQADRAKNSARRTSQQLKTGTKTGRRGKESPSAPAADPSTPKPTRRRRQPAA